MPTSTARLAANRRNSQRSTGPKTAEGKAASRLNAFQHGMAGAGDLVGPGDDRELVAERAEAFARELHADGVMGHLLAHRAALLSVRMANLANNELIAISAADAAARVAFDADRVAAIDELLTDAEQPGVDPAEALEALAGCPDGLVRLLVAWRDLLTRLGALDPGTAPKQAARWLGLASGSARSPLGLAELTCRVGAEINRLQRLAGTMAPATRAIEQARIDAGRLARFDPGPEATLARRYEAAAERGMYRAIRLIATFNRQGGRLDLAAEAGLAAEVEAPLDFLAQSPAASEPVAPVPPPPPPPASSQPLPSFRAEPADPLASFRIGILPAPNPAPVTPIRSATVGRIDAEVRQSRPDLRKIHRKLAASRR